MRNNSFPFIPSRRLTFHDALLLALFLMNFLSVICTDVLYMCDESSNYTSDSRYSTNLNLVINDLFLNAPQSSGFNTSSHGQSPSQVYGLLQCTGNISAASCSNCVQHANSSIQEVCANDIGGRIWLDDCFFRYGNSNFISILDTDGVHRENVYNITGNKDAFESTTTSLLSNLSNKAYIPANKGYADGSVNFSASEKLYGLVQCWRDISLEDCITCLVTARAQIKEYTKQGKQGAQVRYGSCMVRFEIYPFFNSAQLPSPSPNVSTPPSTSTPPKASTASQPPTAASFPNKVNGTSTTSKEKSSKTLLIVLGLVGGIIVLLICVIVWRKAVKSVIFGRPITITTPNQERHGFSPESGLLMQEQKFVFSFKVLAEATENFHDSNKLGEGGFGAVYKGITRDGIEIAVKKLSVKSSQGKTEFLNEVKLVANVQHRNLVRLLGCCVEGSERLLVYEYFPNKSLDTFLFDLDKGRELDWQRRYNIIIGIARGLLYLHEDSHLRVIHRDIKTNNILLDNKLYPKIADFGLARLFPEDKSHIHTRVAGTYGYMAPEYAMQGQLSVKVDVYSFGVVLLEIVSGRKNTDVNLPYQMENVIEWAWKLFKKGNELDLVDSKASEVTQEQASRCIHIALLCVQADARLRPPMSNVYMMITSSSETLPNPSKPAFVRNSDIHASKSKSNSKSNSGFEEYEKRTTSQTSGITTSSSSLVIRSVNEASITEMEAR